MMTCVAPASMSGTIASTVSRGESGRTDVTTVEDIVAAMESRYGLAQRIWVMDRGMTSKDKP